VEAVETAEVYQVQVRVRLQEVLQDLQEDRVVVVVDDHHPQVVVVEDKIFCFIFYLIILVVAYCINFFSTKVEENKIARFQNYYI
jgi:hypothetical protein